LEDLVVMQANPSVTFWQGRRVLLTGHTGFKGAWLALWLSRLGAQITGIGLSPAAEPNLFQLAGVEDLASSYLQDIRDASAVAEIVRQANPEIVFHLAAQALVRASYRDPLGTFATNIQGTANLLDALRPLDQVRVVVAVTTDKVYRNFEHLLPYRETDALGGHDPYSASKAAAEMVVASYRDAFLAERGVAVASARAGNVIGGGDWSEDRIIPDAVRAWGRNQPLIVRYPESTRPWQHVLEPVGAYLRLAERLWRDPKLADAYNFGPYTHNAATVRQVITLAREAYGAGEIIWGDVTEGPHEAGWLTLETAKARHLLGVVPHWDLRTSVVHALNWYQFQAHGESARSLCDADINTFEAAALMSN
jgi:CDP-glucose 4,6-dehydratase